MKVLSKKAEEKSSGQPGSTDESEATEADKQPDVIALPLRCAHTKLANISVLSESEHSCMQELICYNAPLNIT